MTSTKLRGPSIFVQTHLKRTPTKTTQEQHASCQSLWFGLVRMWLRGLRLLNHAVTKRAHDLMNRLLIPPNEDRSFLRRNWQGSCNTNSVFLALLPRMRSDATLASTGLAVNQDISSTHVCLFTLQFRPGKISKVQFRSTRPANPTKRKRPQMCG